MRQRFLLVFNPGAGRSDRAFLESVLARLAAAGATIARAVSVTAAGARAEVRAAVTSGPFDAVIAAGGDGTIRQVAVAAIDSGVPVGIIPVGTANVLAHEIGLVRNAAGVAQVLLDGTAKTIAVATANGEPFLLMAGAGFDGRVIAALDQGWKARIGKAAFVAPVLATLARPLDVLHATIDGRPHTATWIVAANARHYGGAFVIAPDAGLTRPGLQAILFHARSRRRLFRQLAALGLGHLERRQALAACDIEIIACSDVTITAAAPVPTQIDGDPFGATPLVVRQGPATVALIMPQAPAAAVAL